MANDLDRSEGGAHKAPMKMATATLLEAVQTADEMQRAVYEDHPVSEVVRLREIARAQFEAYLDLMAEAAIHVKALKP